MKTTLEIPDAVFRQAKAAAAERGIPLQALVTEALTDALKTRKKNRREKPVLWGFGALRHLHKETARINRIIEDAFEKIDEEDRA